MLRVTNRAQFSRQISAWTAKVRAGAEAVAKNMADDALENVTRHGPQFSGQFVASWNLSIGKPYTEAREPAGKSLSVGMSAIGEIDPYSEGDWPAISAALKANHGALSGFKLGQTIFLANNVSHDEAYSWKIERNEISFRDDNPSKGNTLARANNMLSTKYARIGKGMLAGLGL